MLSSTENSSIQFHPSLPPTMHSLIHVFIQAMLIVTNIIKLHGTCEDETETDQDFKGLRLLRTGWHH